MIWKDGNERFTSLSIIFEEGFRVLQVELRDESQRYRSYLNQRKLDEQRQQTELDRILQIELDKQNAKRAEKVRAEQEKRSKLLHEVIDGRQQQLIDRGGSFHLAASCSSFCVI